MFVKAGQRMKLPWTRYKSVKRAKKKHRATKVAAWKSGLHADQLITDKAKRDTDSAIISAKAHYESKIIDQSAENPKRFWNYIVSRKSVGREHSMFRLVGVIESMTDPWTIVYYSPTRSVWPYVCLHSSISDHVTPLCFYVWFSLVTSDSSADWELRESMLMCQ